ncbi:MAG: threonine-phosphate decarboxylase CobD [Lachnospiraceae bacterium]|nr:threonine-phosphate decarboxylase CobD [Lachnospiraceae bacterium]
MMKQYEHGGGLPYQGKKVELDFSVNLHPFGMPPAVAEALRNSVELFQNYPDPECRELKRALAEKLGTDKERILFGNGADDLLYRVFQVLRPQQVLVCDPCFSEYERAAKACGAEVRHFGLKPEEEFSIPAAFAEKLSSQTGLVCLCTPNNPTGKLVPEGMIRKIAERCRQIGACLLLDECFLPFTERESAMHLQEEYPNLLVLRAFTKSYALAGLRLGYMVSSDPSFLQKLREAAPVWAVSAPAQTAGLAALSGEDVIFEARQFLRQERPRVTERLRAMGFRVWESDCNFLLFQGPEDLGERLLEKGIAIRDCSNYRGLRKGFWRIGLKTREENDRLLEAAADLKSGGTADDRQET